MLEKFFKLKENGTNVKTEIIAGITSFMTMAYILAVNPSIMSAAGMDHGAVFTATALAAFIGTLAMALFAELSVCPGTGYGTECVLCLYRRARHGIQLAVCSGCCLRGRYHLHRSVPDKRA